jgi:hypothetical protein
MGGPHEEVLRNSADPMYFAWWVAAQTSERSQ